ncbi:MAG: hypothetical protein HUJ59_05615 [Bacilli bacterium]|nr:hypothetical protein [Bacilli bacterium]MCF0216949.1 hypothetical protein [Fibrobacteraceae bacterium]
MGAAAAATGGAVGGGLAGAVAGGAVGGAGNYISNYAGQKIAGNDADFNWLELGKQTLIGGVSGAAGYGGGQLFNGMRGALAGGFAGGAVGSAVNGDSGWDILQGGLMGAAMGGISYAANIGAEVAKDRMEIESIRSKLDNETPFKLEGLDDLYQKQLQYGESMSSEATGNPINDKVEFGLKSGSNQAEQLEYDIIKDVNHFTGDADGVTGLIHAHGELQPLRTPSPGDLRSAAAFNKMGIDTYQMDVVDKVIYKYDSKGIVETFQYRQQNDYKTFGQRFQW